MVTILTYENGQEAYHQVVNQVLQRGVYREPRGEPTLDLGHTTVVLREPYHALPLGTGRKVSHRIAAAEAIQLIGGFSDPGLLPKSFDAFKEDSGDFHGAYGKRIIGQSGNQMIHVVRKLEKDPNTRQAVITLWDSYKDNVAGKRDYPCTIALGYGINRWGKLDAYTTMRSNDVWLGAPYDWFQFTQLQITIASMLGIEAGEYHHTAWSLHLYKKDFEKVANLHPPEGEHFHPVGLAMSHDPIDVMTRVRRLPYEYFTNASPSEQWYYEHLRP